ncbi:MAG: hypothetical protein ABFC42_09525, partial [Sulfuricella sp.]
MRRALTSPLLPIIFIVALASVIEFTGPRWLLPLENRVADLFVRIHARDLQPDPDIVIVDLDDRSLAQMNDSAGS